MYVFICRGRVRRACGGQRRVQVWLRVWLRDVPPDVQAKLPSCRVQACRVQGVPELPPAGRAQDAPEAAEAPHGVRGA